MKSLSLGRGVPLTGIREGVIAIKCEFDAAAMQMDIPPMKLAVTPKQTACSERRAGRKVLCRLEIVRQKYWNQGAVCLLQPNGAILTALETPAHTTGHGVIGIVGAGNIDLTIAIAGIQSDVLGHLECDTTGGCPGKTLIIRWCAGT